MAALIVYGVVLWLGYGLTYTALKQDWYSVFNSVAATYKQAGMSAATTDEMTSYARRIVDVFAYVAPGILGTWSDWRLQATGSAAVDTALGTTGGPSAGPGTLDHARP